MTEYLFALIARPYFYWHLNRIQRLDVSSAFFKQQFVIKYRKCDQRTLSAPTWHSKPNDLKLRLEVQLHISLSGKRLAVLFVKT